MQLISPILESVLELKTLSITTDSFRNGFYHCETVNTIYDDKWNILSQTDNIEIKNKDEKTIQEKSSSTKFKTDEHGNVIESSVCMYADIGDLESDHKEFRLEYDEEGRLIGDYCDTVRTSPDGVSVNLTMCVNTKYDAAGNHKMITCDYIPKEYNDGIRQIRDVFNKTVCLFEYDDTNQLQAVNMMNIYHDYFDRGSSLTRYVIKYDDDGYIDLIHQEGTEDCMDEIFEYYDDGTIVVTKNDYDDGVVVDKVSITFIRPYHNQIQVTA